LAPKFFGYDSLNVQLGCRGGKKPRIVHVMHILRYPYPWSI
jgi:hypothetical protein